MHVLIRPFLILFIKYLIGNHCEADQSAAESGISIDKCTKIRSWFLNKILDAGLNSKAPLKPLTDRLSANLTLITNLFHNRKRDLKLEMEKYPKFTVLVRFWFQPKSVSSFFTKVQCVVTSQCFASLHTVGSVHEICNWTLSVVACSQNKLKLRKWGGEGRDEEAVMKINESFKDVI